MQLSGSISARTLKCYGVQGRAGARSRTVKACAVVTAAELQEEFGTLQPHGMRPILRNH